MSVDKLFSQKIQSLDPNKKTIVIIDGYSSGQLLAPAFRKKGYQTIHVHSRGRPPKANYERSFHPADYDADIPYDQNLQTLLQLLQPLNGIRGVLTGADSGVLFSDILGWELKKRLPHIPSNGVDEVHKDKFLQNERLREHGIDSALQIATASADEAVEWVKKHGLFRKNGQVVIKPTRSASTDGVYFCKTEEDIRQAMGILVGEPDEFGHINNHVLVQEYLEGLEYIVNTTSLDGHDVVTDIWVYQKKLSADGLRDIYDYDVILPYEGEIQKQLVEYNLKVLKALGIRTGNGHAEIKMVPGRGPVLVEMNNRMMGANQPLVATATLGQSQLEMTVLSYEDPEAFKRLPLGYKTPENAGGVIRIANDKQGDIFNPEVESDIVKLPGYLNHGFTYAGPQPMSLTIDLNTIIGSLSIVARDKDEFMSTLQRVRQIEREGGFRLSASPQ
jgi:hypothetical protein